MKKPRDPILTSIGATLGAAGFFFGLWLLAGLPLLWAGLAGAASYAGLYLVFSSLGAKPDEAPSFELGYVDEAFARETVAQGRSTAARLRALVPRSGASAWMAPRAERLAKLMEAVADDVEADPKDAPAARAFLGYQGDAALRLAGLVADLARHGSSPERLAELRARVERTFDLLAVAFERHLESLEEDNLAELRSELDLLEESVRADSDFDAELDRAAASARTDQGAAPQAAASEAALGGAAAAEAKRGGPRPGDKGQGGKGQAGRASP